MVRERARRNDDLGSGSGSGDSASLLPNYSSAGEKNKEHNEPEKRYVREGREGSGRTDGSRNFCRKVLYCLSAAQSPWDGSRHGKKKERVKEKEIRSCAPRRPFRVSRNLAWQL